MRWKINFILARTNPAGRLLCDRTGSVARKVKTSWRCSKQARYASIELPHVAKIDDRINAWLDSLTTAVGRWISARPWYMQLMLYPLSLAVALVSVYAIYGFIVWLAFTALAVPLRPLLTEAYTFLLSGAGHPLAILLVAALVALLLSLIKESPLQIIYGLAQLGIGGIWLFVTLTKFRAS